MQKIVLISYLVFSSAFCYADSVKSSAEDTLKRIQQLNGKDCNCSLPQATTAGAEINDPVDLAKVCIKTICSGSTGTLSLSLSSNLDKVWDDSRMSDAIQLFKKTVQTNEIARTTILQKAEAQFASPKMKISEQLIDAKAAQVMDQIAGSIFDSAKLSFLADGRMSPHVDRSEAIKQFVENGFSKADAATLVDEFQNDSYATTFLMEKNVTPSYFYDNLKPGISFQKAIRDDAKIAQASLKKIPKTSSAEGLGLTGADYSFNLAKSDQPIDDELSQSLFHKIRQIYFAKYYYDHPKIRKIVFELVKKQLNEDLPNQKSVITAMIKNKSSSQLDELNNPRKTFATPGESLFKKCFGNLAYALENYPTEQQIQNSKPVLDAVKSDVIQALSKVLSPETLKCIQEPIAKIQFVYPLTKDEYFQSFKNLMQSHLDEDQKLLALAKKDQGDLSVAYSYRNDLNGSPRPLGLYEDCRSLGVRAISDHTEHGFNVLSLSAESIKSPDVGKSIVAHEIGHIVSNLMQNSSCISEKSKEKFLKSKTCIEGIQPPELDSQSQKANYDVHFEEDFADVISAISEKNNMWCSFYTDKKLNNMQKIEIEASPNDPHSSFYMRLLQFEINKTGELPNSCLRSLPKNFKPGKCL